MPRRRDGPMSPTLGQIIEDMAKGIYQLPDLQRDFVWDDDKRVLLCDSINQGLPIGSILVWRTRDDKVFQTRKEIRGVKLPDPPGKGESHYYVIDGLQRLTTLYLALHREVGWSAADEERTPPICFDLSNPRPERGSPLRLAVDLGAQVRPPLIPLHVLFQPVELRKYQMKLLETNRTEWLEESDRLVSRFRDYEIPVIPLVTDDRDLVAETFVRVNSSGSVIEEKDVVRALLWSHDLSMDETFEHGKSELEKLGWGTMDQDLMLMVLKVGLDLDAYRTKARDIVQRLKARPETLTQLPEVLAESARLFNQWGIYGPSALPYSLQFVAIAWVIMHHKMKLEDSALERLERWVYQTAYGGYFRGMPGDRFKVALDHVEMVVTDPTLEPLPEDCSRRVSPLPTRLWRNSPSAREQLFAIRMAREIDQRLHLAAPSSHGVRRHQEMVGQQGGMALIPLHPGSRSRDPGNLVICTPEALTALRGDLDPRPQVPLFRVQPCDPNAYLVSDRARALSRQGHIEAFIEERRKEVNGLERAFVESLGLTWVE